MPPRGGAPGPKSCARVGSISRARSREVAGVEQCIRRDRHRRRIADIPMRIGERELHRLDLQVLARDRIRRQRADVERASACRAPSAPRCPGRSAESRGRSRRDSRCAIGVTQSSVWRCEIVARVRAAVRIRMRDHRVGELAAIERLAVRRRDRLERRGHRGRAKQLAGRRGAAVGRKCSASPSPCGIRRRRESPFVGDDGRNRIAVARVADRAARRGRRTAACRSAATTPPIRRRRRES